MEKRQHHNVVRVPLIARAYEMADEMIYFGRVFTKKESLAQIDAVTPEKIHALARMLFEGKSPAIVTVGPEPARYKSAFSE